MKRMSVRAICVVWALGCLGTGAARAQSVRIENVTVVPRDAKTAAITFDISWNGSWRTEINHDAAWVFFKARVTVSSRSIKSASYNAVRTKGCLRY